MLKKLYRHEFHALFRSLWPLYAGLLVLALLSRLMDMSFFDRRQLVVQILYNSFMSLYVLGIIAMLIISFAVVIVRFYRHLLTGEGYLSFTLPFTAGQHITCKLVCGVVAGLVSFAFTVFVAAHFEPGHRVYRLAWLFCRPLAAVREHPPPGRLFCWWWKWCCSSPWRCANRF